jgi:hypothetical protein
VTNWLADPVACAIRLKDESGCTILAGRNEVLSRSTRCYRTEERGRIYWRAGNVYAVRDEDVNGRPVIRGGVSNANTNHSSETPEMLPEVANMLSDTLRAAYANSGTSACGGKTMLEVIWDELMVVYERLVTGQGAEDDVGIAQGLAYAIAIINNPYRPDIDHVRLQAANRWEAQENETEEQVAAATAAEKRAARRARRAR